MLKSNNPFKNTPRSLLVFYVLVSYVVLQFCWWFYLLFDLNNQIYDLRISLSDFINQGVESEMLLRKKLSQKHWMILGEGLVFILLLLLGIIQTRKSFRRETRVIRQQKNFLLSVTHELKSPIASVKLYLQTLEKRDLDRPKQIELLQKAIIESNRLDQLVENILVTAQIDNHVLLIQKENRNLSDFFHEIILEFNEKYGIALKSEIQNDVNFWFDQLAFRSILVNLIENALKYSNSTPDISVKLWSSTNSIFVSIADQGIGIQDDEKLRVFEKFFRSGNEETRQSKGTGLGLYIVKYLVEHHQGSISIRSNTPKGSIFELQFITNTL
jgi:two-component system phosphate regulon sensor histidine kinase PhoR